jgi:tRNA (cytidine/uridine-2'-O-)-methyltransferase
MFSLILYQPEIPPNTGNIIRLCANTGTALHLVEPLGFELDEARLRRAGLDYREFARVATHHNLADCLAVVEPEKDYALSTRGVTQHSMPTYAPGDAYLLGPETRGLPQEILDRYPPLQRIRIPMRPESRSLNLSNAVAVIIYEAWRQQAFADGR